MASLESLQAKVQELINEIKQLPELLKVNGNQVDVVSLSEITEQLGLIRAGEFRSGNSKNPGQGFSGVRIGYPPFSYENDIWNIVGINDDSLQFGLKSTDGKAYFAGGLATLSANAFELDTVDYGYRHTATGGGESRIGRIGMVIPDGETTPAFQIIFEDADAASELLTNGTAETGDETGWTDSDSAWSVSTTSPYAGTYCFNHAQGTACPGVLTQNVGSLSASTYYTISFASKETQSTFAPSVTLVWKDSGSSTLRTDVIYANKSASWTVSSQTFKSPASTASVDIKLSAGDSFANTYFDSVSFYATSIIRALAFMPDLTYTGGNLVIGDAALATDATDGFLYIPTCAGAPTGTPTSKTGTVAMVYDTSNEKLYIYNGGWVGVTLS